MSTRLRDNPSSAVPSGVLSLIGNTPMIPLHFQEDGVTVYAKCEFLNPSGSIKDRFARHVLLEARASGKLDSDSVILECSSGNTGIALAMVGAVLGYGVTILMNESASIERRHLMNRLGAKVILLPAGSNYQTGIDLSRQMAAEDPRIFLPRQFENEQNTADHQQYTGVEIIQQMDGPIDAFVSGYGTGGTLSGCGRAIKGKWPDARIVSMKPEISDAHAAPYEYCYCIEGVAGSGFVPPLLRLAPIDQTVEISAVDALTMTRRLHREFGLLVGTSSGANIAAALVIARELGPDAKVVTILCDRAERYFSTALFSQVEEPSPRTVSGAESSARQS